MRRISLIDIEAFIAAATASINDTNTAGVADVSGAQTKAVLIGIDYAALLRQLVNNNYSDCCAADGDGRHGNGRHKRDSRRDNC